MNIEFLPQALTDLDSILDYIAQDNRAAADQTVTRILQSIRHLETFPLMGRDGSVDGTRELPIPGLSYCAIYEIVSATDLVVLRILHTSRKWPPDGS
ncbi:MULTISPECIES: type II toxin-antitoxin system RelE/ParE family toxin [Rhodobacterales]|uniref:Type II toxin-antitoxin system RelE/ParE family toxin n=1 Tax=Parasulfitobacter algicola TaxID=2614809 RepID=A0ABX2IVE6_9RHOB|nr:MULTISPECIES: type II toxin-antitoxin system RelE/ParE family toxin [Rhodobacterales]NSX56897.1 type II toxin-antitoxin system RelE/ParE family toxin [Sulfitobacter algicola]